jgi:hypothetical protein
LRMRGRHHRILGMHRGAAGEVEIPHQNWLTLSLFLLKLGAGSANLHGTFMQASAMPGACQRKPR